MCCLSRATFYVLSLTRYSLCAVSHTLLIQEGVSRCLCMGIAGVYVWEWQVLAAGDRYSIAVGKSGKVYMWGNNHNAEEGWENKVTPTTTTTTTLPSTLPVSDCITVSLISLTASSLAPVSLAAYEASCWLKFAHTVAEQMPCD